MRNQEQRRQKIKQNFEDGHIALMYITKSLKQTKNIFIADYQDNFAFWAYE